MFPSHILHKINVEYDIETYEHYVDKSWGQIIVLYKNQILSSAFWKLDFQYPSTVFNIFMSQ